MRKVKREIGKADASYKARGFPPLVFISTVEMRVENRTDIAVVRSLHIGPFVLGLALSKQE